MSEGMKNEKLLVVMSQNEDNISDVISVEDAITLFGTTEMREIEHLTTDESINLGIVNGQFVA